MYETSWFRINGQSLFKNIGLRWRNGINASISKFCAMICIFFPNKGKGWCRYSQSFSSAIFLQYVVVHLMVTISTTHCGKIIDSILTYWITNDWYLLKISNGYCRISRDSWCFFSQRFFRFSNTTIAATQYGKKTYSLNKFTHYRHFCKQDELLKILIVRTTQR